MELMQLCFSFLVHALRIFSTIQFPMTSATASLYDRFGMVNRFLLITSATSARKRRSIDRKLSKVHGVLNASARGASQRYIRITSPRMSSIKWTQIHRWSTFANIVQWTIAKPTTLHRAIGSNWNKNARNFCRSSVIWFGPRKFNSLQIASRCIELDWQLHFENN